MKPFRFGPIALTATLTTNLLNPPTATGGVNGGSSPQFILLQRLRIVNKTASIETFSLWLGLTGANTAGTEVIAQGQEVQPNKSYDWYSPGLRIDSTNFLVGGASVVSALTIEGEGLIGVA